MTRSFIERYRERVEKTNSVLCVGLDLTPAHVPPDFCTGSATTDVYNYGKRIINIAAELVPAVKLQFAYYAALDKAGSGMLVLKNLIKHAQEKGLLAILDFKRCDIGATMEAYGDEGFKVYGADACTLGGPYFGPTFWPAWKDWLNQGRLAINMVRTSNKPDPEDDMQMWKLDSGERVYERVAKITSQWHGSASYLTGGKGAVGAVFGATHPAEAERCRELLGDAVFVLVPGYGAQGGGADGAVAPVLNSRGEVTGTVNSSRGITLYSWFFDKATRQARPGDPLELVENSIQAANADLNQALERRKVKS